MPDNTDNLPIQGQRDPNVLDFTVDEILEELREILTPAPGGDKRPTDFNKLELAEKFGVSEETVRTKMKPVVEAGKWLYIKVMTKTGEIETVYRKA